ncbi:MAG TPA: transporter [bacterium]|uniref:MetA-pathway of phenol degradation n=1 Tax=candidate division TA06 bacterium ADurb.Bin417 TaxID=1852828 RepID=A0A1V5M6X5_UNCT6|nr:MAG: hypothetical protein BWY73_01646 [candidate division TA06 bacterium ADurb.Bin417]HNQ34786.1 transporter [bacterium]HNS48382.1 transporter [bacterium]
MSLKNIKTATIGGFLAGMLIAFSAAPARAYHPLVTDDAGTLGRGGWQLEVNGEFGRDREGAEKAVASELSATLGYGLGENLDLILGLPYLDQKLKTGGATVYSEEGLGDLVLELKWLFHQSDGLALALKPTLTLPTGKEERGLGNGRPTGGLVFIATRELNSGALHLNAGYLYNDNRLGDRKDIWHLSLAGEWAVTEKFKLVGNIGTERNPDPGDSQDPAFFIAGFVYQVSERLSLDLGLKTGLNDAADDSAFLAGMTILF